MIEAMPKPRKPYLHRETTRHGKTVWYFRRNLSDKRIRIYGDFGSADFTAAYDAALAGQPFVVAHKPGAKGSLKWLSDKWRESSDWHMTSTATKRQRENILSHIIAQHGALRFKDIQQRDIVAGREKRMKTPFAANNFLKTMKAMFGWAKENGLVKDNPAAEVKFLSGRTVGHEPWTPQDLSQFRDKWGVGTRQRLAMEILYWTGLRRGDAVRLGRQHVNDGVARITTEKTGRRAFIPISGPLSEIIRQTLCGDLTFICKSNGRPYTKESFGNEFRSWCNKAGVTKSAHGLRKTAASELADAGGTEMMLRSAFTWESQNQSSTYTRSANQDKLAVEAMEKRMKHVLFPHPQKGKESA